MFDDFRAALRSLRNSPTFTRLALAVLALGIGAGAAIFSAIGPGVAWPLSSLLRVQTFLFQVEPTDVAVVGSLSAPLRLTGSSQARSGVPDRRHRPARGAKAWVDS